ncbi:hypothetical protein V6N13_012247 [Hibiscus sabdariffa]
MKQKLEAAVQQNSALEDCVSHLAGALKAIAGKSLNASSRYAESLTDSQSDSGEWVNLVEIDTHKMSGLEANKEPDGDSLLKAELEAMTRRTAELKEKLEKMEVEKAELEIALTKTRESFEASGLKLRDTEMNLEGLQRELCNAKQHLESQLGNMEADVVTMPEKINSLEKERALSTEVSVNANAAKNKNLGVSALNS